MVKLAKWLWQKIGLLCAVAVVLLAVLSSVLRVIVPMWLQDNAQVERWVSRALHQTITLSHSEFHWHRWHPSITLHHIILYDEKKQPILSAERLNAQFSLLASLFSLTLDPQSIELSGIKLTIAQIGTTAFTINGYPLPLQATISYDSYQSPLKWILNRNSIALSHIDLLFKSAAGKVYSLIDLNVIINNSGAQKHYVKGGFHLARDIQSPVSFGMIMQGTTLDPEQTKIDLYLNFRNLVLGPVDNCFFDCRWQQALKQWLQNLPDLTIDAGKLSAKIWAKWEGGQWQKIQSQFDLEAATFEYQKHPYRCNAFSGTLSWSKYTKQKWDLLFDKLHIVIDKKNWPTSWLQIQSDENAKDYQVKMIADRLSLSDVRPYLGSVYNYSGQLQNLRVGFNWHEPFSHFIIQADAEHFHSDPQDKFPGVDNLTGAVIATQNGLQLQLNSSNITLDAGKLLPQPLYFNDARGLVSVLLHGDTKTVQFDKLQLVNSELDAQLSGAVQLPSDLTQTEISVLGKIHCGDLGQIKHYYPVGVMKPRLFQWLTHSLKHSDPFDLQINLRGLITHFPFVDNMGVFEANTHIEHGDLRFNKAWPSVKNISTDIEFLNQAIYFAHSKADILNVHLSDIKARIPNLQHGDSASLLLSGDVLSTMEKGMNFIRHTPLQHTLGSAFRDMEFKGPLDLHLALSIPLDRSDLPVQTKGEIRLSNSEIVVPLWHLSLNKVMGNLMFNQDGLLSAPMHAELFGKPVTLRATSRSKEKRENFTEVLLQGHLPIEKVLDFFHAPTYGIISGSTDLNVLLSLQGIKSKLPDSLRIRSDLVGIQIDLPEPFAKKPQAQQRFLMDVLLSQGERQVINLVMANRFAAAIELKKQQQGIQLTNAHLSFAKTKTKVLKNSEILVDGHLDKLDLSPWIHLYKKHAKYMKTQSPNYVERLRVNTNIGRLLWANRVFRDINVKAQKQKSAWLLSVNNRHIKGDIAYPLSAKGSVVFNFSRLHLKNMPQSKGTRQFLPGDLQRFDFYCKDCKFGRYQLGKVTIRIEKNKSVVQIHELSFNRPNWLLRARGSWRDGNNGLTKLSGELKAAAVQQVFQDFNVEPALQASKGELDFDIDWRGSLFDFAIERVNGQMALTLHGGEVLTLGEQAEQQIATGKLLTFLSLRSLRRRLSLDHKAISNEGFDFDILQGTFHLQNGNAVTKNAYLDGPIAFVGLRGKIGLAEHNFDVQLDIIPYVTSSLPVVATIAGGPVLGVITWVADQVVSPAVGQLTSNIYRMQGSWDNPKITLLQSQKYSRQGVRK